MKHQGNNCILYRAFCSHWRTTNFVEDIKIFLKFIVLYLHCKFSTLKRFKKLVFFLQTLKISNNRFRGFTEQNISATKFYLQWEYKMGNSVLLRDLSLVHAMLDYLDDLARINRALCFGIVKPLMPIFPILYSS